MLIKEADFGALVGKADRVIYLCHRNADPDAIGSGFALSTAFGGDLGCPGDLSKAAKRLADDIGANPIINPDIEGYELSIVVDTSVALQLGDLRLGRYGVVDHHLNGELLKDADFYIHHNTDSTAEIIWRILKANGRSITRESALGLVVGIISDTGRFKHASSGSFQVVGEILEQSKIDYGDALDVLARTPMEISQRIAMLKAASRAEIEWDGEWIVATTMVSSFEGSAAMALVELGADAAFAGGKHGAVCRISGRAKREATAAGLDLSNLMRDIARARGGEGGGHKGAAALEAPCRPAELLFLLRRAALNRLSQE
jgi:nanoRNase/pAp phosphatase (c-di-AMP/oligoRNAs hydrolase)